MNWVKAQRGSDKDIAVKFRHDLGEYIGSQNFKIARGAVMRRSLENLQSHLATSIESVAGAMRKKPAPVRAFLDAVGSGSHKEMKKAIARFREAEAGPAIAPDNVEGEAMAEEPMTEEERSTAMSNLRQMIDDYEAYDKDLSAVDRVIRTAKKDLQHYRDEEIGVMNYLKNFEGGDESKPTNSVAESVERVLHTLREEKESQKDIVDSMRREMATHRGDVEKLVRSLWVREPVDRNTGAASQTRLGGRGSRSAGTTVVITTRGGSGGRVVEGPAVPRGRAPSAASRWRPSRGKPRSTSGTASGGSAWMRIMTRYRARR